MLIPGSKVGKWAYYLLLAFGLLLSYAGLIQFLHGSLFISLLLLIMGSGLTWHGWSGQKNVTPKIWLGDLGNGFTYSDDRGDFTFRDEEVRDISMYETTEVEPKLLRETKTRHVTIVVSVPPQTLRINAPERPGEQDVLHRIVARLAKKTGRKLGGQPDDVAALFQPLPGGPAAAEELGPIEFELPASVWGKTIFLIIGVGCLILGGLVLSVDMVRNQAFYMLLAMFFLGGLAALGAGLYGNDCVFRCHQHGLYLSALFSIKSMRFEDIEAVSYQSVRTVMIESNAFTEKVTGQFTTTTLTFESAAGVRMVYKAGVTKESDQLLDTIRDRVCELLAARMLAQLKKGQIVDWTTNLRFTPKGLEYVPTGLLGGSGQPVLIPYKTIRYYMIKQDEFLLNVEGKNQAVVKQSASVRNFYPGLHLLERIKPLPKD